MYLDWKDVRRAGGQVTVTSLWRAARPNRWIAGLTPCSERYDCAARTATLLDETTWTIEGAPRWRRSTPLRPWR